MELRDIPHNWNALGITVAKSAIQPLERTYLLRLNLQDARVRGKWQRIMESLLLAADRPKLPWGIAIDQTYFVKDGGVRFLWRVAVKRISSKDAKDNERIEKMISSAFAKATQAALDVARVELTEMPLPFGRAPNGDTRGIHTPGTAERIISAAGRPS